MLVPSRVIESAAASGATRQIQAATITGLTAQEGELVDVEVEALARDRDDQAETDDDLGGRHCHHGKREDLAARFPVQARESDQGEVRAVEHDLEREQHDQRTAAK